MQRVRSFSSIMQEIGRSHDLSSVFSDFLTLTVCALSLQQKEAEYLEVAGRYSRDEMFLFSEAFGSLVLEMDKRPLSDKLGDFFMEFISYGHNGQFFTPEPICRLMARIIEDPNEWRQKTVSDPACGSGRLLLASAEQNRFRHFYGADVSLQCCQMTLINLCLNGLTGVVSWMDTLSFQIWKTWIIEIHSEKFVPYIRLAGEPEPKFGEYPKIEIQDEAPPQQIKPIFKRYSASSAQGGMT